MLNLAAVVGAADEAGGDVGVVCAGVQGTLALGHAFVAGRIVQALGAERLGPAEAAVRLAARWGGAEGARPAARSGAARRSGTRRRVRTLRESAPHREEALPFCARESVLDVLPRFVGMHGAAAEVVA